MMRNQSGAQMQMNIFGHVVVIADRFFNAGAGERQDGIKR